MISMEKLTSMEKMTCSAGHCFYSDYTVATSVLPYSLNYNPDSGFG
jgi:hypothetical protein